MQIARVWLFIDLSHETDTLRTNAHTRTHICRSYLTLTVNLISIFITRVRVCVVAGDDFWHCINAANINVFFFSRL